jgi:hypothetical protein
MKYLGPLSSLTTNSRQFYVDLSNQLDIDETLSTILVTTTDTDVTLSNKAILGSDVATRDGITLPASQSITFRATCAISKNTTVPIVISYTTSNSNSGTTTVYLKIVDSII